MAFALLWLAALAAGLLWMAAAVAAASRLKRLRRTTGALAALPVIVPAVLAVVMTAMFWRSGVRPSWLGYTASWLAVFVAGAASVAKIGLRTKGEGTRACGWDVQRLLFASGASAVLALMVFGYLDLVARARVVEIRLEAQRVLSELAPPRVAPGDDARPLYEAAYARFEGRTLHSCDVYPGDPSFDPLDDESQAYLRLHARTIEMLREAARRPIMSARPLRPYLPQLPDGSIHPIWAEDVADFRGLGTSASLLILHAMSEAASGSHDEARRVLLDVHAIAYHIGMPAGHVDCMIAIASEARAIRAWERLLYEGREPGITRDDLPGQPAYRRVALHASYARAVRNEEARMLMALSGGHYYSYPYVPIMSSVATTLYRIFFLETELYAMRKWHFALVALNSVPYHQAVDHVEAVKSDFERGPIGPVVAMLSSMHLISINLALADVAAQQSLLDCALAASVFRTEQGRYPDSLDELVPDLLHAVPVDPFDGEPLRSLTEGDGMRIYSIGRNLTDDGGRVLAHSLNGDIVFCLGDAYRVHRLEPAREASRRKSEGRRTRGGR